MSWGSSFRKAFLISIAALVFVAGGRLRAQAPAATAPSPVLAEASGAELFRAACAACHGLDGRGAAPSALGFIDLSVPDFTDCAIATVEPISDWLAVAHDGGPARGFDRRMPAFGEVFTEAQILRIVDHLHTFCDDAAWPRGDLNLPRALFTEKAFPENESVFNTSAGGGATGSVTQEVVYERRIGSRAQYEIAVPLAFAESDQGEWNQGLGDVAVAVKRVIFHSLNAGSIFTLGTEALLPTGKETLGLGKGVTIFEPFLAFGQILPRNSFLQFHAGAELPVDREKAEQEAFWRTAIGTTFEQAHFGRAWTPMLEILGARELEAGQSVQWDAVPQMQVTLNQRQHLMINAGVRVPLNGRDEGRRNEFVAYFLWDWFDGGLRDGW